MATIGTRGTYKDPRDGQVYKTVVLPDGNTWLAENLNFDQGEGCWFYNNNPENGKRYGRLYSWAAAQWACPPNGWFLPGKKEVLKLFSLYDDEYAYEPLLQGGKSGFDLLFGGTKYNGYDFQGLNEVGQYWIETKKSPKDEYDAYYFDKDFQQITWYSRSMHYGLSVRCIFRG